MSKKVIKKDVLTVMEEKFKKLKGKNEKGFEASTTIGSTDEDQKNENSASTGPADGK